MKWLFMLACCIVLCQLACPRQCLGRDWISQQVGTDYGVMYTSIAAGQDGDVHIVYGGRSPVRYAYKSGPGFATETVDQYSGAGMSLVLGSDHNPRFVYVGVLDSSHRDLIYAERVGGTWNKYYTGMGEAYRPHLALTPTGDPRVACTYSYGTSPYYIQRNGGTWTKKAAQTESNNGDEHGSSDLWLDNSGTPQIAYRSQPSTKSSLCYTYYNGTSWVKQVVDNTADVGYSASMAMDDTGVLNISYIDNTDGTYSQCRLAQKIGSTWSIHTLGVAYSPTMLLDAQGLARVVYVNADYNLCWSYYDTGGWHTEELFPMPSFFDGLSVAVDPDNNVHAAFIADYSYSTVEYRTTAVPEPSTMLMAAGGLLAMTGMLSRRRRD